MSRWRSGAGSQYVQWFDCAIVVDEPPERPSVGGSLAATGVAVLPPGSSASCRRAAELVRTEPDAPGLRHRRVDPCSVVVSEDREREQIGPSLDGAFERIRLRPWG